MKDKASIGNSNSQEKREGGKDGKVREKKKKGPARSCLGEEGMEWERARESRREEEGGAPLACGQGRDTDRLGCGSKKQVWCVCLCVCVCLAAANLFSFSLSLFSGALFLGILFFGFISDSEAGWLSLNLLVRVWFPVSGTKSTFNPSSS